MPRAIPIVAFLALTGLPMLAEAGWQEPAPDLTFETFCEVHDAAARRHLIEGQAVLYREVNGVDVQDGRIARLCNLDDGWSVDAAQALREEQTRNAQYFVCIGRRTVAIDAINADPPHLRTRANETEEDNLLSLPNCDR